MFGGCVRVMAVCIKILFCLLVPLLFSVSLCTEQKRGERVIAVDLVKAEPAAYPDRVLVEPTDALESKLEANPENLDRIKEDPTPIISELKQEAAAQPWEPAQEPNDSASDSCQREASTSLSISPKQNDGGSVSKAQINDLVYYGETNFDLDLNFAPDDPVNSGENKCAKPMKQSALNVPSPRCKEKEVKHEAIEEKEGKSFPSLDRELKRPATSNVPSEEERVEKKQRTATPQAPIPQIPPKVEDSTPIPIVTMLDRNWTVISIKVDEQDNPDARIVVFWICGSVTMAHLAEKLSEFGKINSMHYFNDRINNRPNVAIIQFADVLSAQQAINVSRGNTLMDMNFGIDFCPGNFYRDTRTVKVTVPPGLLWRDMTGRIMTRFNFTDVMRQYVNLKWISQKAAAFIVFHTEQDAINAMGHVRGLRFQAGPGFQLRAELVRINPEFNQQHY